MFQHGKRYKRYKRMHELLTLAMESFHFEIFIENQKDRIDIIAMIITMKSKQDNQLMDK